MNRKLNLANLARLIQMYSRSLTHELTLSRLSMCIMFNVYRGSIDRDLFQYEFLEVNVRVQYA